jgi:hypothetical protein
LTIDWKLTFKKQGGILFYFGDYKTLRMGRDVDFDFANYEKRKNSEEEEKKRKKEEEELTLLFLL